MQQEIELNVDVDKLQEICEINKNECPNLTHQANLFARARYLTNKFAVCSTLFNAPSRI